MGPSGETSFDIDIPGSLQLLCFVVKDGSKMSRHLSTAPCYFKSISSATPIFAGADGPEYTYSRGHVCRVARFVP